MAIATAFVLLSLCVHGQGIKERFNSIHELVYEEYKDPGYFLTGYFPVHFLNASSATGCGKIDITAGLALVEAMRFAMDSINRNESLLFGTKIGYQLVDTCNNLERIQSDIWFRYHPSFNDLGIVGPASSDAALLAAPILTGLGFPVVSYAATSVDLADQVLYDNFYRTIPPDTYQSAAIGDLLQHFNWTFVSTVYSQGNFGQRGMEIMLAEMAKRDICVRTRNLLPRMVSDEYVDDVIKKLYSDPSATVVVIFTIMEDTLALLRGIRRAGKRAANITIISSASWTPGFDFPSELEEAAKGSLILSYANMRITEFEDYFLDLQPKNANYTWFLEFWRDLFKCNPDLRVGGKFPYPKCTGKESLREIGFHLNHTLSRTVISAVHNFACILRKNVLVKYCKGKTGIRLKNCVKRNHYPSYYYPRYDIYKALLKKKVGCPEFHFSSDFLDDRSVAGELEILNFDGKAFQKVGTWNQVGLNTTDFRISSNAITWTDEYNNKVPISSCTLPCNAGEVRFTDIHRPKCCITCRPCPDLNIVINNSCVSCRWSENPNADKDSCIDIPVATFALNSNLGTALFLSSTVGALLAVALVFYCIMNYRQNGVCFTNQCFDILASVSCILNFSFSTVVFAKPSEMTCTIEYLMISLATSSNLSIFLLDAYHINQLPMSRRQSGHRIVASSVRSKTVSCVGLIASQCLLDVVWLISRPRRVHLQFTGQRSLIILSCRSDIQSALFQISRCQLIIILVAYFANRARRYNAARVKATALCVFSAVASGLVAVFIPLLLWANQSNAISESALVIIAFSTTGWLALITTGSHLLAVFLERRKVQGLNSDETNLPQES